MVNSGPRSPDEGEELGAGAPPPAVINLFDSRLSDAPRQAAAETEILAEALDIPVEVAAMLTPEQTHRALTRLRRLVQRLTRHVEPDDVIPPA
jgi:hypothetical protein